MSQTDTPKRRHTLFSVVVLIVVCLTGSGAYFVYLWYLGDFSCSVLTNKLSEQIQQIKMKEEGKNGSKYFFVFQNLKAVQFPQRQLENLLPEKMPRSLYESYDPSINNGTSFSSDDFINGAYFSKRIMAFAVPVNGKLKYVAYLRFSPLTGGRDFIFTGKEIIERLYQWTFDPLTGLGINNSSQLFQLGIEERKHYE